MAFSVAGVSGRLRPERPDRAGSRVKRDPRRTRPGGAHPCRALAKDIQRLRNSRAGNRRIIERGALSTRGIVLHPVLRRPKPGVVFASLQICPPTW